MTGVVALYAEDVGVRTLYFRNGRPLAVEGRIAGVRTGQGPYLVLATCRCDAFNQVHVHEAYARNVLGQGWLFPVTCAFEREVLRVLLALQERLDAFGWTCSVSRDLASGDAVSAIALDSCAPDGRAVHLALRCTPASTPASAQVRSVTPGDLASGRLVAWLAEQFATALP